MEGNPSGFLTEHQSLEDYATKQWVEDKGYITGIDIQESANWNEATTVVNNNSAIWNSTTETVSSNSAAWGSATPQIPVTGINGIKISESGDQVVFEVSGDYYTNDNPSGFITGVDLSDYATTAQLAEKQDSLSYGYHDTAISSIDESAIYDTSAHARINTLAGRISDLSSNKQDVSGMTAYQPTMTFGYDENNAISSINESALAGTTYSAGSGIDITGDVISVTIPYLNITNNVNTSQVTYGDLKALCDGTKLFNLRYGNLMYYVARAKKVGSHCELIFSTPNLNTEYDNYTNDLLYTKFKYSITVFFFTDDIADNTVAYINGNAIKHVSLNTQPNWNETNTLSETYIQNKPDLTQYQTTAGMTAYQGVGDYYSASNPSGFITGITYTTGTI